MRKRKLYESFLEKVSILGIGKLYKRCCNYTIIRCSIMLIIFLQY